MPGSKRPFLKTFEGSTGNDPASEDITTIPSLVNVKREGLKPFLSNIAPTISPSVKESDAGPSHASIKWAWYL